MEQFNTLPCFEKNGTNTFTTKWCQLGNKYVHVEIKETESLIEIYVDGCIVYNKHKGA